MNVKKILTTATIMPLVQIWKVPLTVLAAMDTVEMVNHVMVSV
jgi:hypothetical protein